MPIRPQFLSLLGVTALLLAFQNCENKDGEVVVSTNPSPSSSPAPSPFPAPNPNQFPNPIPNPLPNPNPQPMPFPNPNIGANPLPLGLKASFSMTNVPVVGSNNFPMTLNMAAPGTIQVDIGTNNTPPANYAVPNVDFVPFSGQTITYPPGSLVQPVVINILLVTGKPYSFTTANCRYNGNPFSCIYLF